VPPGICEGGSWGCFCWVFACSAFAFHTARFLANVSPAVSPLDQKKQAAEKETPALTKLRTEHPKSFSRITYGPPAGNVVDEAENVPSVPGF
jgi:hypothetical protein